MIKKKLCMVGSFAVGKTSLVRQFVESIFSEKYLTTVGVKIDKKSVTVGETQLDLVLWDIAGEEDAQPLQLVYLRGASGYLLVADGTRRFTLEKARTLQKKVEETIGKQPFVLVLNKSDLVHDWEVGERDVAELVGEGWDQIKTSAKTGSGVEDAFHLIARKMLDT